MKLSGHAPHLLFEETLNQAMNVLIVRTRRKGVLQIHRHLIQPTYQGDDLLRGQDPGSA
jgi:hypothetical protein